MISSVDGVVVEKSESRVVLDVGGIGIEINVPAPTIEALGGIGDKVRIHTYLHVREDVLQLFGFPSEFDRSIFRLLIGVSGVGPKVALSILSAGSATELVRMIHEEDVKALVRLPGIGKKTAERIVLELKDKLPPDMLIRRKKEGPVPPADLLDEAVEALVSLGMSRTAAQKALERIPSWKDSTDHSVENIVRMALKRVPL
jgi:Holliday junction DNA helicase RuvA